jgi:hypothetical protein
MDNKILKNHILYVHQKATYVLYESGLGHAYQIRNADKQNSRKVENRQYV